MFTTYTAWRFVTCMFGSGRIRTYSAIRQQIVIGGAYDVPILPTYFQSAIFDSLLCYYSLSRLSNCGADPYVPTTLFYNHPRESDNQYRTAELVWHLYLVRLYYNPLPTKREVNFSYILPVLLSLEKLRLAVSSPLKTILFSGNVTSTFTAFL